MFSESLVKVLSSKMGISRGGNDLKDSVIDGQQRDIECSTTEIEDKNVLLLSLLVKSIGNSGGSGLVDDSENVKA